MDILIKYYLGFIVIGTLFAILIFLYDKSEILTKEEYLLHLKEFNYDISNPETAINLVEQKIKEIEFYRKKAYNYGYSRSDSYQTSNRIAAGYDEENRYIKNLSFDYLKLKKYYDKYNPNYAINKFIYTELGIILIPPIFTLFIFIFANSQRPIYI